MTPAANLLQIPNVQIYPSPVRVELNDKATKILFNMTPEVYQKMVAQGLRQPMIERRKFKKKPKVQSSFVIQNQNGYTAIIELDEFDRAVLSVCVSEWEYGNRYTTPDIIYRGLTGKTGRAGLRPSVNQYNAILQSIDKLMGTLYDPQVVEAFDKLNYEIAADKIVKAPILPCERHQKTINGKVADVIYFTAEPTLLRIASAKNQIIRYPIELLDVPNQNNNPKIIMIKSYILRRVFEIKSHRMTPVITLEDIYKKARLTSATKLAKSRANDYVIKFFEHLKAVEIIKGFEQVRKGKEFTAVKIFK